MSVLATSISATHTFYKSPTEYIYLVASQVHLIASELLTSLAKTSSKFPSYHLAPGALGENITTSGLDLLSLTEGTLLHFGDHEGHAVVRVTGVREPWKRVGEWPEGLLERIAAKERKGRARVGVYGVVEAEGYVQAGYVIYVEKGKGGKLRSV